MIPVCANIGSQHLVKYALQVASSSNASYARRRCGRRERDFSRQCQKSVRLARADFSSAFLQSRGTPHPANIADECVTDPRSYLRSGTGVLLDRCDSVAELFLFRI